MKQVLAKVVEILHQGHIFRKLEALVRGTWHIWYYRLVSDNVRIKFPFKAYAAVKIIGPGRVVIDRYCSVNRNNFRGLSIVTASRHAEVLIGKRCNLGGLTIRCRERVVIGGRTMTASSLIQDFLFMDSEQASKSSIAGCNESVPVAIGSNVWIASKSVVLPGSEIGDDCVIAAGSVTYGYKAKPYTLIHGNPAWRSLPIGEIMSIKENA